MKFILIPLFLLLYNNIFASDSALYSCKYRYTWQKDSTKPDSKFNDVMILSIYHQSTVYYSYLKQLGYRNLESDALREENMSKVFGTNVVSIDAGNAKGNYYTANESQILAIDFKRNQSNVTDKFFQTAYGYSEPLSVPDWKLTPNTEKILGRNCRMATAVFKGRKFTAWFDSSIPFPYGPWLFTGLPGLILKVADDKGQFVFECIELNTSKGSTGVYHAYQNIQNTTKKKLNDKKMLLAQNPLRYMQMVEGKTITATDASGSSLPVIRPDKPYNPIDLNP